MLDNPRPFSWDKQNAMAWKPQAPSPGHLTSNTFVSLGKAWERSACELPWASTFCSVVAVVSLNRWVNKNNVLALIYSPWSRADILVRCCLQLTEEMNEALRDDLYLAFSLCAKNKYSKVSGWQSGQASFDSPNGLKPREFSASDWHIRWTGLLHL